MAPPGVVIYLSFPVLSRGEGNAKLSVAENQRRENPRESPKNSRNSTIISDLFNKKECYVHAVRWQDSFRMGFALCELAGCKTAKMWVG